MRKATSTITGVSALVPASLPFASKLASSSGAAEDAVLTSEDGVRLGLRLAAVSGFALTPVAGQVNCSKVSYPTLVAAQDTPSSALPHLRARCRVVVWTH